MYNIWTLKNLAIRIGIWRLVYRRVACNKSREVVIVIPVEIESTNTMTVAEFAKAVNVSEETLYRRLKKGEIAGQFRLGRCWRIDYEEYKANRPRK